MVNGQRSMVNGQWSKRLRDKGRKNRLFETLILYFLRKISSIDFYLKNIYLKNIKRERGLLKQEIYLWKSLLGNDFLIKISSIDFYLKNIKREGRGMLSVGR